MNHKQTSQNKFLFILFFFYLSILNRSFASDFIVPNSGGEPIKIDISSLNQLQDIDVTIGSFTDQPRTYKNENTKEIVIFPPAIQSSEKTITVRAGGSSISKTVSFREIPRGDLKLSALPDITYARAGNTTNKLSDGRILLIGGSSKLVQNAINTIEIFNPESGLSETLKTSSGKEVKLNLGRSQHTATYLGINNSPIGKISGTVEQILIVGGFSKNGIIEGSIEILEIKVGTNLAVSTVLKGKKSKLISPRLFHTATQLPNGKVIIIGGQGEIGSGKIGALKTVEIFDPISLTVSSANFSLEVARELHSATVLQDGNILIAGGFTNENGNNFEFGPATKKCELIDSVNLTIETIDDLKEPTGGHTATLLQNGLVVFIGGSTDFLTDSSKDKGFTQGKIQFYNPSEKTFEYVKDPETGNSLELQTPRFLHSAVLFPNGRIAIIGGLNIKKTSGSSGAINTPVSTVEVINPIQTFQLNSLDAILESVISTAFGRVLPSAILILPKEKNQGFLSTDDASKYVNAAIFLTGGFTNGLGLTPTTSSELIQIDSNIGIEGRSLSINPDGVIQGGFIQDLNIKLDNFSEVSSVKVLPQSINLSISNDFMSNALVITTSGENILLKADADSGIVVSPSLFQSGDIISISSVDSSQTGIFNVSVSPVNSSDNFVKAEVLINVSDSAKPFLTSIPSSGLSLNVSGDLSSKIVNLKVVSQDGSTEVTSIPRSTSVTAAVSDPSVASIGSPGFSAATGTLDTDFVINGIKAGNAEIIFQIDFPEVLGLTLPIQVNGNPEFTSTPIDPAILTKIELNGSEFSGLSTDTSNISFENFRMSPRGFIFPIYVPVNLKSSLDNSIDQGLFTIRPLFGVDLFTSNPRSLISDNEKTFRPTLSQIQKAFGGITTDDENVIGVLAFDDGIRTVNFKQDVSKNINESLNKINMVSDVTDLVVFTLNDEEKIAALRQDEISIINPNSGVEEKSIMLSEIGSDIKLTTINEKPALVVASGGSGVDLVLDLDSSLRLINFQLQGNTREITIADKLENESGPFAIAVNDSGQISIVNLSNVSESISTISSLVSGLSNINYAGKFTVNGSETDVLIANIGRKVLMYDLNKLTSINFSKKLPIKRSIRDLIVIDGIAYFALGNNGVLAVRIGSLLNNSSDVLIPEIISFVGSNLTINESTGSTTILTKTLNITKLSNAKPFLLLSGPDNNLAVVKVIP